MTELDYRAILIVLSRIDSAAGLRARYGRNIISGSFSVQRKTVVHDIEESGVKAIGITSRGRCVRRRFAKSRNQKRICSLP